MAPQQSPDPRISLKRPWLAGLLAFLVPGAGHCYQGRYFKSVVYFVCITGLFLAGMRMSDWKAMYLNKSSARHGTSGKHTTLRFAAQFGVGSPSLWALVQRERYYSESNTSGPGLDRLQSFEFNGRFREGGSERRVSGTVELEPFVDEFGSPRIRGRFAGTDDAGSNLELMLGNDVELDSSVGASRGRELESSVVVAGDAGHHVTGRLEGTVPRPVWNWFAAPLEVVEERELHRQLGKLHELAMVFTWVAGLLNLLAIWDAVEGPAYGYGDEPEPKKTGDEGAADQQESATADATRSESAELSPEPVRT